MAHTKLDSKVGSLVAERPGRSRVFEKYGIDYCCQGGNTLGEACTRKGIEPNVILSELDAMGIEPPLDVNWQTATLTALCDHIQATHHAYLKTELPRLRQLAHKVAERHGDADARLQQIAAAVDVFSNELTHHMGKEELILFPLIRGMESGLDPAGFHCGSIRNPIRVMEMEHTSAGSGLERMRALSDGYKAPEWACPTYRALLDGLNQLELDMHQHVHKENNILFPRAVEYEDKLAAVRL